jgi:hypothetical protein
MFSKEHLDGNGSIEQKIPSEIDVGHAASRQLAVQFVAIVKDCGACGCVTHRSQDYDRFGEASLHLDDE